VIKEGLKTPTGVEPSGDTLWFTERATGKVVSIPHTQIVRNPEFLQPRKIIPRWIPTSNSFAASPSSSPEPSKVRT
jgi:hypothetical protein